jgi:hypothetical protein
MNRWKQLGKMHFVGWFVGWVTELQMNGLSCHETTGQVLFTVNVTHHSLSGQHSSVPTQSISFLTNYMVQHPSREDYS